MSKRIESTLPKKTVSRLLAFAKQHGIDHSLVVQRAITQMSSTAPTDEDINYTRGPKHTSQIQISLSDTSYQLLELWSKQTNLSKSKLITYSLQNTIEKEGEVK